MEEEPSLESENCPACETKLIGTKTISHTLIILCPNALCPYPHGFGFFVNPAAIFDKNKEKPSTSRTQPSSGRSHKKHKHRNDKRNKPTKIFFGDFAGLFHRRKVRYLPPRCVSEPIQDCKDDDKKGSNKPSRNYRDPVQKEPLDLRVPHKRMLDVQQSTNPSSTKHEKLVKEYVISNAKEVQEIPIDLSLPPKKETNAEIEKSPANNQQIDYIDLTDNDSVWVKPGPSNIHANEEIEMYVPSNPKIELIYTSSENSADNNSVLMECASSNIQTSGKFESFYPNNQDESNESSTGNDPVMMRYVPSSIQPNHNVDCGCGSSTNNAPVMIDYNQFVDNRPVKIQYQDFQRDNYVPPYVGGSNNNAFDINTMPIIFDDGMMVYEYVRKKQRYLRCRNNDIYEN